MGMIQYMACAKAYPTCSADSNSIDSVCNWLCDLMPIRCSVFSDLYKDACASGNASDKNCSFQRHVMMVVAAAVTVLALIL